MATFESAGVTPVYNAGGLRVPGHGPTVDKQYAGTDSIFADLLDNKDIVGGQVAANFVGDTGLPIKFSSGTYVASVWTADAVDKVDGLLLAATDAYDGPRLINVIKGGTINTKAGALKGLNAAKLGALAAAVGGKYDATFNTIKF